MRILVTLCLIFGFASTYGQPDYLEKWSKEELSRANTAAESDYLTAEEKAVILFSNLARLDGKKFTETVLLPYLKHSDQQREGSYSRSLVRDLKKVKGLPLFEPSADLTDAAFGHAKKMGKRGLTGHAGFKNRASDLSSSYSEFGENCDYGREKAIDIVMSLLIDEGIRDLGHRKNLLDAKYQFIGVSIQPHKRYRVNCVQEFGG